MPEADNTQSLGDSTHRWKLYGTITGSLDNDWKIKINNTQRAYNGSADVDAGSIYAPTTGGTANTQALVGNGATTAPKWANISPSISITAGTSSAAPKVNVTILGQSGTAQAITTATTGVYGATKLTDAYTSTDATLAATGKSILAAIQTLDVGAQTGAASKTLTSIAETNGKITGVTYSDIAITASQITSGALGIARGGTGNSSFTASRLIYSESAAKLSSSGHYASSSKVAINSTSEPSYNLYVDGTSYHNGLDTHAGDIVPDSTRSRYLGTSSLYWDGAYINGNGAIHWNNLTNPSINGTTPIVTSDSQRGMGRIIGGRGDSYRPSNTFFGVKKSSTTFEYTTDGGTTWTAKDISVVNLFNEATMVVTPGFNTTGTAFDQYDATNANSTTGGGSGVTYAANYWTNKGIRITFDCWDEGRTGTIDFLLMRFGCAGSNNKAHYRIERQHYTDANAGNDTWTLIYESPSTAWGSNDRRDQIYPNPNFYLSGTSTSAKSSYPHYAQKIRITFIVDAWPTAYRYAPRIISIAGYGAAGSLRTANAGTGSEFARAMVTWNHPYLIEDRNTGALGFDSDLLPRERSTEGSAIVTTDVHNIGTSSRKWANVYATTIHGALDGNATTATRANITTTTNALAYYTDTTGAFGDSAITITKASKHIAGFINGGQRSGTTLGNKATAEGCSTAASGDYSHAEGFDTMASGDCSHAEGYGTMASEYCSHAEGEETIASGVCSHAEGVGTTAQRRSQHVFGEYNVLDTPGSTLGRGSYVEIVGNGTADDARSNARTLDWSGNEWLAGTLTAAKGINLSYAAATITETSSSVYSKIVFDYQPHIVFFIWRRVPRDEPLGESDSRPLFSLGIYNIKPDLRDGLVGIHESYMEWHNTNGANTEYSFDLTMSRTVGAYGEAYGVLDGAYYL